MPDASRARTFSAASAIADAAGALDRFCAREALAEDVAWRLRVCLDEIMANVTAHGAAPGRVPNVSLELRRDADHVVMIVSDDGPEFNPLLRPDPDVTLPLETRQPGGLGISLVKSLMDDVRYERTSRNVLTMRKRIGTEAGARRKDADHPDHP